MYDDKMDMYVAVGPGSPMTTPRTTLQDLCWMWGLAEASDWEGKPDKEYLENGVDSALMMLEEFVSPAEANDVPG